ncbi:hypothetical protein LTR95_015761 [Oleoguttula sp. CCFEE 5521]
MFDGGVFSIRNRDPTDLPACLEILSRVYEKDGYPVQGPSLPFLQSPNTISCWVASPTSWGDTQSNKPPGRVVGHVALSTATESDIAVQVWRDQKRPEPVFVLERLFVDPEHRRWGVAGYLMASVVDEARERGGKVVLFALIKDQGAMKLYERLGWTEFGRGIYGQGKGEGVEMEAVCFVAPEGRVSRTGSED